MARADHVPRLSEIDRRRVWHLVRGLGLIALLVIRYRVGGMATWEIAVGAFVAGGCVGLFAGETE